MKKHPQYSVPDGILVMDEKQAGISAGLGALLPFSRSAVGGESPIERNIRIDGALFLQNDLHEGGKYRYGDGTPTAPSISFAGSPGTGIRRPAANVIGLNVAGVEEARIDASRLTVTDDIRFKSGTAFAGDFEHNNSADRTYTFPNASGTVALTTDPPGAHATTHENGGTDEISVAALSGELADPQKVQVLDEAIGVGARKNLNFVGAGVTATEDAGNDRIDITIPGGASSPHDLLDGTQNQDTLAATVSRGSLVVGNSTPKWSELVVGGAGTILKSDGTDATWGAPTVQQSALLDGGTVHTDTLNAAVARGAIILGNATPKWDRLVIGGAGQVLRSDGTDAAWARNYGTTVYVPTAGDTDISEVTDVTIATRDVASVAAGDIVIIEGEFIILNDSAATRVYVITLDFDAAFDIEISTGALANSSTLLHPFTFRATCSVRSSSLAYAVVSVDGQLAAGVAGGGDTTMAATHLSGKGWGTSAADLTGTLTCALKIRSANANATQTCRLVCFEVRRITPGTPSGA